ncbi:All-trans-phytoene synthase [mine drainage metagenome]|uniref:All-trans-phytoene synthase n=1 Tax=mine drainage metagenome TaxID=410659 RepID=A0A1J5T822_9ZZZZ
MLKSNRNLWHTHAMTYAHHQENMAKTTAPQTVTSQSLIQAQTHYENFPVASIFLPKHLREPIGLIYSFARQADDFADEGDLSMENRLTLLNNFREELDLLHAYIKPKTSFFATLGDMIKVRCLPYEPFYDLLDAFSQDVTKTRYADYDEVLDYCKRSANPIGRLMLHLYEKSTPENVQLSDNICTALQIINFLQDIAIDFKKNDGKQRIYMCQDEMAAFGITESQIKAFVDGEETVDENWQQFLLFNVRRVNALLYAGKPLGRILKGRIGFEMRMIIAGGERIISKITTVNGDIFKHRPTLNPWDWCIIFIKALFKI